MALPVSQSDVYTDYQSLVAAAMTYIFQEPTHIPNCHILLLLNAAHPPTTMTTSDNQQDVHRVKAPLNQFNSLIPFTFEHGVFTC